MPDYPSGLALGLRIQGYRVRFPARAGHFLVMLGSLSGHFLVMLGTLFHRFWDVLGCVWEYFGGIFGWVWDGFEKKLRGGRKMLILKNVREYFSQIGVP